MWVGVACVAGCASQGNVEPMADAATLDAGLVSCRSDPRVDAYVPGLVRNGKALSFRLDADPVPPAKGDNSFRIAVENASGEPAEGELAVSFKMPDHGHSAAAPNVIRDASGVYLVGPVNLFMPGVWRVELDWSSSGAVVDSAVFYFCVEG